MVEQKILKLFKTFIFFHRYSNYDIRLKNRVVFGRAWSPLKMSARLFLFLYGKNNYNNILMHAKEISFNQNIKISKENTFNFTIYLEKILLQYVANIMRLPFSSFSGYTTSGATEANIYAMWIAREWARKKITQGNKIYWIIPNNTHYSIKKALQLLDIYNNNNNEVLPIETDLLGQANYKKITEYIKKIRKNNNNPIILSLTVMTTECGSIDPVKEIDDFINKEQLSNIFFHVDAAFSCFLLPFVKEYSDIFSLKYLSSISIDFHKTLGGPTASGAIIFHPGLEKYINRNVSYLLDGFDQTLLGSRKGTDVIANYSILSVNGVTEIKKDIQNMFKKTIFFAKEISTVSGVKLFYPPKLNYIIFSISNIDQQKKEKMCKILKSYSITSSLVNIESNFIELFKVIIRSDHNYNKIKKLTNDLKNIT